LVSTTSLGHNDPITRDIARDPNVASEFLGHFTVLRLLAGFLSYAVLVVLTTVVAHYPVDTTVLILIMGLSIIAEGLNQLFRSLFTAFEKQSYYSATNIAISVVNVALVWLLLSSDSNLQIVAWARLVAMMLGLALSLVLSARLVPLRWLRTLPRPDWTWMGRQLSAYFPFTLITVFYAIEWRADVLILSASHSQSEVGRYYTAVTVLTSLLLLLEAYRLVALPRMAKLLQQDTSQLVALHDRSMLYLLALAVPLAVGTAMLGPQLLTLLKPSFVAASGMLAILMVALVISFLNEPSGLLMIAGGYQKQLASIFVVSLTVNIGANLILVPRIGGFGSAIARVLSVSTFSVIVAVFVARQIRAYRPLPNIVQVGLATAGMAVALWSLQRLLPWWLAGLAAAGVYTLLLIVLKGIPGEDLKTLQHFLRSQTKRRYGA
jgi:O-antigen/teichoic acid export membrane protein